MAALTFRAAARFLIFDYSPGLAPGVFVHSATRFTSSGESFFGELTAFDTGKTSNSPSA
jgi:hypothetical protein